MNSTLTTERSHLSPSRPRLDVVRDSAQARLARSPHRQLRGVRCDLVDDTLVLRGEVGSYYLKQLAQESVRGVRGVQAISNLIQVDDGPLN